MPRLGLVTIDSEGIILDHDEAFCRSMRAAPQDLIGCNALDITAPADRERCATVLGQLLREGGTVGTTKRLIRRDGTHLWVHNSMTLGSSADGLSPLITIVIEPSDPLPGRRAPHSLLEVAKRIHAARRLRNETFGSSLFMDPAWDLLVAAYIFEAEGRVLTTEDLHAELGIMPANAARWMRALSAETLLEYEDRASSGTPSAFRLTVEAHAKFERYLSEAYLALAPSHTPSTFN